jgi:hypothetical protein
VKAIRITIHEIDHEDRERPLHLDLQMVRVPGREKILIRSMLLKAVDKFSDAPGLIRPRD